jgi:hypothetical protein
MSHVVITVQVRRSRQTHHRHGSGALRSVDIELVAFRVLHPDRVMVQPIR